MNQRPFIAKYYENPGEYVPRTDAPSLIDTRNETVIRHDLFETNAPAHTRKYMLGLDVISWEDTSGAERSHLFVNQKAGALVMLWEAAEDGIWVYLQETYRAPHSKDDRSVKQLLAAQAFDALGVWSLEAPAGGLSYVDDDPVETPTQAALREVTEETGLSLDQGSLLDLMPGGLQISGDISTKRSYLFAANIASASYKRSDQAIEDDEAVGHLLGFKIRSRADMAMLTTLTRIDAGTTSALALSALQPTIYRHFTK